MRDIMDAGGLYSGTESHRYVERFIRDGRELDIVTPYISLVYARMLCRHARRFRVRLVTSRARQNAEALRYLGRGMGPWLKWLKASLFVALLAAASLLLGFMDLLAPLGAIAAALGLAAVAMHGRTGGNLAVRLSRETFIHEKLYLRSDIAITGSANLTYSGLRRNLEHIEVTVDRERIGELERHFDSIWGALGGLDG